MFSRGRSSCQTWKPHGYVPRQVVWSLNWGRHWGAQGVLSLGGTSLKSGLSKAWGCAVGERKTPEKVCFLFGDCFSTLQPLQGLLQKIQFLSLHLRNNKVCVGVRCAFLTWRHFSYQVFSQALTIQIDSPCSQSPMWGLSGCWGQPPPLTANLSKSSLETHSSSSPRAPYGKAQFRVSLLYSVRTFC